MKLRLLAAAVAVAGFLSLSPRASADFLSLEYTGNKGGTATVSLNGQQFNNVNCGAMYWSDVNDPPNGNYPSPITSFCIEVDKGLPANDPPTATFRVMDAAQAPTIATAGLSAAEIEAKVNAIKALYGKNYDFANNRLYDNSLANNRAFQIALWELVYDYGNPNGLNVTNGSFVSGATGTNAAAQAMLNNLAGGLETFQNSGYELDALVAPAGPGGKTQDPVQDQLVLRPKSVPAPPAVLLAGIGVLALVGRARLTRRPATTA